jgi:hypothetical protein
MSGWGRPTTLIAGILSIFLRLSMAYGASARVTVSPLDAELNNNASAAFRRLKEELSLSRGPDLSA